MKGRNCFWRHSLGTLRPSPHFTLTVWLVPVLYCYLIYSEINNFSHFRTSGIIVRLIVSITLQLVGCGFVRVITMHLTINSMYLNFIY